MANRNKPLEWKHQSIATSDNTTTNARIALGLKDDEVAEVHKVMTTITPTAFGAGGADLHEIHDLALSMDPDVAKDPNARANQDDLEWFYNHKHDSQIELTTEGAYYARLNSEKSEDFDPPVLVGTDVGMVVKGDSLACEFACRLYFTRRKANVLELNQVLLKRR